jgi:hypothetical protein
MKRLFLLIFLSGIIAQATEAQLWKLKRLELTGGLGTTTFFGDVGGYSQGDNWAGLKDITFLQTRYNINFNIKYRITQDVNIRIGVAYGILHATDQRGSNEGREYVANTTIIEPVLLGEYYFIRNSAENSYLFNKGRGKGVIDFFKSLDFYVFGGIGGLSYTVEPNDKLSHSQYYNPGGFTAVVPMGLGGSFTAFPNISLGAELGFRYSFSDYLDGYSNPQYSSANDVYYFFNLTVTYRLKINKNVLPSFR